MSVCVSDVGYIRCRMQGSISVSLNVWHASSDRKLQSKKKMCTRVQRNMTILRFLGKMQLILLYPGTAKELSQQGGYRRGRGSGVWGLGLGLHFLLIFWSSSFKGDYNSTFHLSLLWLRSISKKDLGMHLLIFHSIRIQRRSHLLLQDHS
jgi:hypothetical protein